MTTDKKLVEKACLELWEKYHTNIEKLGYELEKQALMRSPDGISIVALIRPAYSSERSKIFREIIPTEYEYNGEKMALS